MPTVYRSKKELPLGALDQALEWGLPLLPVMADSLYGNDFGFRQGLRERHLQYAVQVEPSTVGWTTDPDLLLPVPKKKLGRPRKYPPMETLAQPDSLEKVAERLPASAWYTLTWRQGSRGAERSRFAMLPVWAAHAWRKHTHPPQAMEWLLVELHPGEPQPTKYWLA